MKTKNQIGKRRRFLIVLSVLCMVVLSSVSTMKTEAKVIKASQKGLKTAKVKVNKKYTVIPKSEDSECGLLYFKAPKSGKYKISLSNLKVEEDVDYLEFFGMEPTEGRIELGVVDGESAKKMKADDDIYAFRKWNKLKRKTKLYKDSLSKDVLQIGNSEFILGHSGISTKNYGITYMQAGYVYLFYFEFITDSLDYDKYSFDLKITRTK